MSRKRRRLLLVIPAFGRYELTRIVLRELAWVRDGLRPHGLDVQAAVIADDENLVEAQARGFLAIDHPNEWLGAKFNAGYQHALQEGYDYVHATGSDTFVDPRVFLQLAHGLPLADEVLCGHYLTVFAPPEQLQASKRRQEVAQRPRRADLWLTSVFGNAVYPVGLLAKLQGRPCEDERRRGCDTSTRQAILDAHLELRLVYQDLHQLERVNFGSGVTQVTDFRRLTKSAGLRALNTTTPWQGLADVYPSDLVDQVRDYYASGRANRA